MMRAWRVIGLVFCLGWVGLYAGRELAHDRIFPCDSALTAADGALCTSLYTDLPGFLRAPRDWLFGYYDQYPALSVRRHPPLFAAVEGAVFLVSGVSVFGANLTSLLFSLFFTLGLYCATRRLWQSDLLAASTVLLFLTTAEARNVLRTIWLDLPALSFVIWSIYFYARRQDGTDRSWRSLGLTALCAVLALYTYQLAVFFLAGLLAHLLLTERWAWLTQRKYHAIGLLSLGFLIPLAVHTLYFGKDNLRVAAGVTNEEWAAFVPVTDRFSLAYWTYYARLLGNAFPFQAGGLILWGLSCLRRRPSAGEVLFFLCFLTTYLGFSWIPSKVPRYGLHIALAASPLAVIGCKELLAAACRRERLVKVGCAAVLGLAVLVQGYGMESPPYYVASMGEPAQAILARRPDARILYCGPMDTTFVFYLRQADPHRQARVYRTGIQLTDPSALPAFLKKENCSVVVVEGESGIRTPLHARWSEAIHAFLEQQSGFRRLGGYDVRLGHPGQERTVPLVVYEREGASVAAPAGPRGASGSVR